ncbi:MAG: hypothetical protein QNJ68_02770 [Microcoleaceae cyanobacterium MO_207.B10]|nr:hypothetical protein [Microcoleaceae cyanobacterium MO_207.B10]
MGRNQKARKLRPETKDVSTDVDPTIYYKLKVIAAQQGIPLNALTRRILTYYANSYMPSTPMPPLPGMPISGAAGYYPNGGIEHSTSGYIDIAQNGAKH